MPVTFKNKSTGAKVTFKKVTEPSGYKQMRKTRLVSVPQKTKKV